LRREVYQTLGDCYTFAVSFKRRAEFPPSWERRKERGNDEKGADGKAELYLAVQANREDRPKRFHGVDLLERVPEGTIWL
jgi:hypothetical protein